MKKYNITKCQARRFILSHQGLLPPYSLKGKTGIMEFISRVGCIQYDPLNIVGRNPELVLQARISGFKPKLLEDLLYKERKLVDGWDKMMAIYKTEDWPFFSRYRKRYLDWYGKDNSDISDILPMIREEIEDRGPISSIDLDCDRVVDWAWAPARLTRAALESMYFWGELVIHHRVNTRRVYDFANRHLSEELLSTADPNESMEQYSEWHVLRRIGSVGLLWGKSGDAWIGIPGVKSKERTAAIDRLLSKEKLIKVEVEGIKYPLYMRAADEAALINVLADNRTHTKASVIAPLDNLLWDRKLIEELFDFQYRWEVYKPEQERQYGYYVLPVLCGDRFVARFEPGRCKESGALIIKQWWWEPEVRQTKKLQKELSNCFRRFIKYLACEEILISDEVKTAAEISWLLTKE